MSTPGHDRARGSAEARLLDAVGQLAASDGYARLTVERILDAAYVSRASFYRHFTSIEDCFWAAYRREAAQMCEELGSMPSSARHGQEAFIAALIRYTSARPDQALLLMREGLAAGPRGLLERDALIGGLERQLRAAATPGETLDLPPSILIGGLLRLLSVKLCEQSPDDQLEDGLRESVRLFLRSPRKRWSERLMPFLPNEPRPAVPVAKLGATFPPQRERILRATARQVRDKGYGAVTVTDIVATACTSRRGFYNEFPNKAAAFIAAYEHAFECTVAACTPAFFSAKPWPERVWDSAHGLTSYLSREPFFAYLGFVECYAVGGFVPRVHATQLAFTLFLEDGYRQRREAATLPRLTSQLVVEVIFESGFQVCRADPGLYIRRMLPLAVYVALAPFIGCEDAGTFVVDKLVGAGHGELSVHTLSHCGRRHVPHTHGLRRGT